MHDVPKPDDLASDPSENDSQRTPVVGDAEKVPNWNKTSLDPQFAETAKRVFERRHELLRRLA